MAFAFALMLLAGADFGLDPAWKPVADPLAPARAGKIQCHDPDPAARTCRLMTWFDTRADGGVAVRQLTALANAPTLAAEARFRLTREGDALCGVVDDAYMAGFRIVSSRAPHAPVNDKRLILLYRDALVATLWKRKTCAYEYARADDPMQQEVGTVDGEFAGELMSQYLWIDPGAGWRLKAPG
ncbi:hypothetical protein [Sphingopyxis sp. Root1497]|uniref:hypothetical protein n=1 Tax=Sphingopyxis sp. Root1497 TaxID=1736474 RepID=UPI000A8C0D31|nr:hypothetical protein [Sphingopyxis sp. Root1497]